MLINLLGHSLDLWQPNSVVEEQRSPISMLAQCVEEVNVQALVHKSLYLVIGDFSMILRLL